MRMQSHKGPRVDLFAHPEGRCAYVDDDWLWAMRCQGREDSFIDMFFLPNDCTSVSPETVEEWSIWDWLSREDIFAEDEGVCLAN